MIDLHTHSSFSDGTMPPEKLVRYADKKGIEAIALTDHDTVAGLESFFSTDSKAEKVAGIEISVAYYPGEFHLLGLFIDHRNETLLKTIQRLTDARRRRNDLLIEKVGRLVGRQLTEKDISSENDGEIGRPHIAKFLIKEGLAVSIQDAFDKYIGTGGSLFIEKERLDFHGAMDIIHEAGGAAVLAHPLTLGVDGKYLGGFIKYLKSLGLDGVEVWCSDTPEEKYDMILGFALQNNLLVTGGSDFHGDNSLGIELGRGRGDLDIPYSVYADLKERFGKQYQR